MAIAFGLVLSAGILYFAWEAKNEDVVSLQSETAESLVANLGKVDAPEGRKTPTIKPVSEKKAKSIKQLRAMGEAAVPTIIARLEEIPVLESALQNQEQSTAVKAELLVLRRQKDELIGLLGVMGEKKHAAFLLELANKGAELRHPGTLVVALRNLGAPGEAHRYMQTMFATKSEYIRGGYSVLTDLLLQFIPSDREIVEQIVRTGSKSSRLRPTAILLGVRLGAKEEMLSAVVELLQDPMANPQDAYVLLVALAELVPPDEFRQLTEDSALMADIHKPDYQAAANLHNRFWWADDDGKEALLAPMLGSVKIENTALAMDYMLRSKRVDLLKKNQVVIDMSMLNTGGAQSGRIDSRFVFVPRYQNAATMAGYKVAAQGEEVTIESIEKFGWYK